jgi:hypothetical protein
MVDWTCDMDVFEIQRAPEISTAEWVMSIDDADAEEIRPLSQVTATAVAEMSGFGRPSNPWYVPHLPKLDCENPSSSLSDFGFVHISG